MFSERTMTRIQIMRVILQGIGSIVCCLFGVQGVIIIVAPVDSDISDFWETLHWISTGLLYLLVGVIGVIIEGLGFVPTIKAKTVCLAVNRLAVSLTYLWLGAFVMGGRVLESGEVWKTLGRFTGVVAWFVGACDIVMACCADKRQQDTMPDGRHPKHQETSDSTSYGNPGGKEPSESCGTPSLPFKAQGPASEPVDRSASPPLPPPFAPPAPALTEAQPSSGWADASKPFG